MFALAGLPALAGTEPKARAEEYPAHATAGTTGIGAEYLVRMVPGKESSYFAGDYLVVEVAVFPRLGNPLTVSGSDFGLRINGAKRVILPVTPGLVAAAAKYEDWNGQKGVVASGGMGPGVIVYGPRQSGRFPGDPNDPSRRTPRPVPTHQPGGMEAPVNEAEATAKAIIDAAIEEGQTEKPRSGALYFPWKENAKKAKKVELVYDGPAGKASVKLR